VEKGREEGFLGKGFLDNPRPVSGTSEREGEKGSNLKGKK